MLKLERYGREVKQDTEGFDVIDTDASDTQANAPERSCQRLRVIGLEPFTLPHIPLMAHVDGIAQSSPSGIRTAIKDVEARHANRWGYFTHAKSRDATYKSVI